MGYDLHITRAEHWADNEGAEITAEEWLAVVRADPELTLAPEVGMGPHFARWIGPSPGVESWLDWSAGDVYTKNPEPALLRKMVRLAESLGAHVQGDEGERYTGEEPLGGGHGSGAGASAGERPRKSWWRRLTGG